jgi:hypothetical protein
MSPLSQQNGGLIVPFTGLRLPHGFEPSFAGEFSVPVPLVPNLFCVGSLDGQLLFTDLEGRVTLESPGKGSVSGEAINGVARVGSLVAVSTRQELNFWPITKPQGGYLPHGAHGVTATQSGYFIAPLGQDGILMAEPGARGDVELTAHMPGDESVYVYRLVSFRTETGEEAVACAARLGGIIAGRFSSAQTTHAMHTASFKNLDVVDLCRLEPDSGSLAVAALCRDGSLILFGDILSDKKPKTVKFQNVQGVAYRVAASRGDVYVLTSKGLYVLAKLGSRFANGELLGGVVTPVMPLPMAAVDMNLAWGRWLLVALPDEVRRFDVEQIHEYVPEHIGQGEIQGFQPVALPLEPLWKDVMPTARPMAMAG